MKLLSPKFSNITVLITIFWALVATEQAAMAADPRIEIESSFQPKTAASGGQTLLTVDIQIPDGFILYSPTVISNGPLPLRIAPDSNILTPAGPLHGDVPKVKWDDAFELKVEYYRKKATFQRIYDVKSRPDAAVNITVSGQICDHKSCYNQKLSLDVPLSAQNNASDIALGNKMNISPRGIAFDRNHQIGPVTTVDTEVEQDDSQLKNPEKLGLGAFLLMAILAGFGALLTPCVFPMIPITISFFSKTEGVSRQRNIILAAVYAGSIIIVYTIPGVLISMIFGAGSMQQISTHPMFNVFITLLLLFFGLNLIGVFELRLPSWLINKSATQEQALQRDKSAFRKQVAAVFFMAVTFTLVSFSCTVGFVGGWVLPLAARGDAFYPLIGMMAFSSAFALPFFFLAVFPSLATRLSARSGDWMVAVKVIFGVVELAAAMKFISNLDLHFEWGVVTRTITLWIWAAIFLTGAFIVLKVFQPRAESGRPGIVRILLALILIGFAAKSVSGTGNTQPMGGWIDGWLPPVPYPSKQNASDTTGNHLSFMNDNLEEAMTIAAQRDQALFVDFTGFQCANCRQMESSVFPAPEVKKRLEQMTRVKLYTDGPKAIHTQQREYQIARFQTAVLPFYVILNPHSNNVLATFSSMAENEQVFADFLDNGLQKFATASRKRRAKAPESPSAVNEELSVDNRVEIKANGEVFQHNLKPLFGDTSPDAVAVSGKWTLVNFWASYCAPCKKELKSDIPEALEKYPDIALATIAVEPEETLAAARAFIRGNTPLARFTHFRAPEEWPEQQLSDHMQETYALPSSYLLNPRKEVVWRWKGPVDVPLLTSLFKQLPTP